MTAFPDSPLLRIAFAAALACGRASAAPLAAGEDAGRDPSGIAWAAYAHSGYERSFKDRDDPYGTPEAEWDWVGSGLVRPRFRQLEAGLAAGLRLYGSPDRRVGYSGYHRPTAFYAGIEEAWLRWHFGGEGSSFRVGIMPVRGNPDAVLFGNYLAGHDPFPEPDRYSFLYRERWGLDSLGVFAETVTGASLTFGSPDAPLRAEAWIVREDGVVYGKHDFSALGYLSGSSARGIGWGVGLGLYRALPDRGDFLDYVANDTGIVDTLVYDLDDVLIGGRLSLDLAPLIGKAAPKGHYGGLFAEAALLGTERKPYSGPDLPGRAAWTAGIRFPTFGWLDACAAQGEWRRSHAGDSPWSYGFLIAKRLGPWVEVQGRVRSEEEPLTRYVPSYAPSWSYRREYVRRTDALARVAVRLP